MLILNLDSPLDKQHKLAAKVRDLRIQNELRQSDLASKSGVSLGSIRRFERTGEISLSALTKIALVLGALDDFDQLFKPKTAFSIAEMEIQETKSARKRVKGVK